MATARATQCCAQCMMKIASGSWGPVGPPTARSAARTHRVARARTRIVNVFRFRDLSVPRFMLVALLVGGVLIQAGVDLGLAGPLPIPATFVVANLVGGVVFGIGMATAGYCPGTIVAEAGEGRLDAWVAGLLGLIVGAIVFGLLQPVIMPILTRVGALGRITLAELAPASPWLRPARGAGAADCPPWRRPRQRRDRWGRALTRPAKARRRSSQR